MERKTVYSRDFWKRYSIKTTLTGVEEVKANKERRIDGMTIEEALPYPKGTSTRDN